MTRVEQTGNTTHVLLMSSETLVLILHLEYMCTGHYTKTEFQRGKNVIGNSQLANCGLPVTGTK